MASFRRSVSVMQRNGAVQNGNATFEISSPPKLPHNRAFLALERLLNSLSNSLDLPGALLPRYSRYVERSKLKGLHMKRSIVHYFICFMIGVFLGFTPFLSVNVSKNLASRQQAFSFDEVAVVDNAEGETNSVEKKIMYIDKPLPVENRSLEMVEKLAAKHEALDASYEMPASYISSPFQDVELVSRKLLIIVTATYERPYQAYYLNRLAHTLKVVPPPLLWIVVEMASQSTETAKILLETGVMYRHLVCNENVTSIRNREVHQRNVALAHIEKHQLDGIVLFADDDRMFSVNLFDQMRLIRYLLFFSFTSSLITRCPVFIYGGLICIFIRSATETTNLNPRS